jgi:DNA-binding response OmpR family regulator
MARPRILLVEPLAWLRDVEEELLARRGYHVCLAGTAEAAITQASFHLPAVMLIRYCLPGNMNGAALIEALRNAGVYSPAIGMTGRKEHAEIFKSVGATWVLVLPFGDKELIAAVEAALTRDPLQK